MKLSKVISKEMILCCGTGGVGKTTTAAALALAAAMTGKKVGLITIDPAKRLATSLGLKSLSNSPQSINTFFKAATGENLKGELSALMLDSQSTFYDFLLEIGGKEVQSKFKQSALFDIIADNFGGAHDYMAMEKLHELYHSKKFDLIVLDTPPARHTLDFLDAPDKISKFFDDRIFSWFLVQPRTTGITERLRATGARAALSVLEKLTGEGVIRDFVSIAPYIYRVKNSFVQRQSAIRSLLTSKESGIVFISSPNHVAKGEVEPFFLESTKRGMTVLTVILNRSLRHLAPEMEPKGYEAAPQSVKTVYDQIRFLVEQEEKNLKILASLTRRHNVLDIGLVPEMETDIHDLTSLHKLAKFFL